MSPSDEQLEAFVQTRSLVSIRRDRIDARSLQAVPLLFSRELLLVQYIHDFHLDGQLILRRADITDVSCRATDKFQQQLLTDSGAFQKIHFAFAAELSSFSSLLQQHPKSSIVILESERRDAADFWIDRHMESDANKVRLHEFSGAGCWHDELTTISASDITCCQLNTNYIRHYADYFARQSPSESAVQDTT